MIVMKGVGASPGIAVGNVYLLDHHRLRIVRRRIDDQEALEEVGRFEDAVSEVESQLSQLIQQMPEELREHSGILQSHLMMLRDKMLYDKTVSLIKEEKINAEWAHAKAFERIKGLFKNVQEQYIKERLQDIESVFSKVQRGLMGKPVTDLGKIEEPVILVSRDLSPADTVQLDPEKIMAFVTEMGSKTSHTAILARSIGVPAVVGLENITSLVMSGTILAVDGISGEVVVDPNDEVLATYKERRASYTKYRLDIIHHSHLPAETKDGYRVKVKANIELLEEIPAVLANGAEGIGLFRTEFLYLRQKELPNEEQLFHAYRDVVEKLSPYPVTIRTLDIGGDKFVSDVSLDDEINPALGLRAVRLCLKETSLFKAQLRAILRASAYGQVRLLIPLISGVKEITEVKEVMALVKKDLKEQGIPFDTGLKTGVMIEVPTAVVIADLLAKEADFFSIGTNDLIQYSLAIDRVNEFVAHLYEPLHPGILRMIKRSVDAAHDDGIDVAMCGEMAGEPMYVPILIGLGLDELSMNAPSIPRVKRMIRQVSYEECQGLVRELLEIPTARGVKKKVLEYLTAHFPEEFDPIKGIYAGIDNEEMGTTSH